MHITSNIDEVADRIGGMIEGFTFGVPSARGKGGMADACAEAIAEDIHESAKDVQADPEGNDFPDNEEEYAAFKERKYGRTGRAFGFRTGQMLSVKSLTGEVTSSGDDMEMKYGTGETVAKADGGNGYVGPSDKRLTDREKADLIVGKAAKTVDFYKVGPHGEDAVKDAAEAALDLHIRSQGGQ